MTETQLTFEDVFNLPDPSIQTYLRSKGRPGQNFLDDRISTIIFFAGDRWLRVPDRVIALSKDFATTASLSDEQLIARIQEMDEEVTILMTRSDLIRKLLTIGIEPGHLYSFGHGILGQLGLGYDTYEEDLPMLVMTVPDSLKVNAVSCGGGHTVIITEDDNLYSFGYNIASQLGLGNPNSGIIPNFVYVPMLVTIPND